jgi:hypothetical protein
METTKTWAEEQKEKLVAAIKKLFPECDVRDIKWWHSTPNIADIVKAVQEAANGNRILYYTADIPQKALLDKLYKDFGVLVYDKEMMTNMALKKSLYDEMATISRGWRS